jgi:hypothetical protein
LAQNLGQYVVGDYLKSALAQVVVVTGGAVVGTWVGTGAVVAVHQAIGAPAAAPRALRQCHGGSGPDVGDGRSVRSAAQAGGVLR